MIKTGDCILRFLTVCFHSSQWQFGSYGIHLPAEIRSLISEEVGNIAKLAIVILIEKKLGQGSEWEPYISCLPEHQELHNTIFWNESELEMIRQSSVYQETINQKSQIEKVFLAIRPISSSSSSTPSSFLINNRNGLPANLRSPLFYRYWLDFRSSGEKRYSSCAVVGNSGILFNINHGCRSTREVRSAGRKGKGLPQSLRALARVLSCTATQEVNDLIVEAAKTDGRLARRPLQDINREIQAHLMLSSLFIRLIEERKTTIMSFNSSNSSSLCERLPVVIRLMARDLLHGKLRVLKSTSTWLENYCSSLT
ncbi:uncharacterized protein LOC130710999 [Lotus japonicus]|uniref:uncharacterized protein LOC130710999 n=1 Tax=Lotus japonicus TaxID=34305 RepID=UPI002588862C|nr:uncharacterized protein LOC130710999 [Lotus japonicus]